MDSILNCLTVTSNTIDTGSAAQIRERMQRIRKTPLAVEKEEETHIKEMLERWFILSSLRL
jgi:hypothetical protein